MICCAFTDIAYSKYSSLVICTQFQILVNYDRFNQVEELLATLVNQECQLLYLYQFNYNAMYKPKSESVVLIEAVFNCLYYSFT